jgi:hypothetical protein
VEKREKHGTAIKKQTKRKKRTIKTYSEEIKRIIRNQQNVVINKEDGTPRRKKNIFGGTK